MHVQYQQQALGPGRNGEHGSSTSSMHCTGLWSKEHSGHSSKQCHSRHTVTVHVHTGLVTIAAVVVPALRHSSTGTMCRSHMVFTKAHARSALLVKNYYYQ